MKLVLFVVLLDLAYCAPKCPANLQTGTTSWYTISVFCGMTVVPSDGVSLSDTEIQDCLDSLGGSLPAANANLNTALTTLPDCAECIFNFIRDISVRQLAGISCTTTWIPITAAANWNSALCLGDLYEPITSFNACADNGLDVRTGAATTRCSYDDYVAMEKNFRPWPAMVQLAINNVPVNSYASQVAAFFSTQLASMACKPCYDTVYASMRSALGTGSTLCSNSPFDEVCTTYLSTALAVFGQCTGGLPMRTQAPQWCTPDETELVGSIYRPYESLVTCSVFYNANTMKQFEMCMRGYNGLIDLPPTTCAPCFVYFIMSLLSQQSETCKSNPLSGPCIDSLQGYRGALPEFSMCAGFDMSTSLNVCTMTEQSSLQSKYKSYVPMVRASMSAFDLASATQVIVNDLSLTNLRIAISHLTCYNCYRAFLIDSWYLFYNSGTKQINCAELTSDYCTDDILKQILNRFADCAGFRLTYDSPAACTNEEASNQVLAFSLASEALTYINGTDFAVAFPDIYRASPGQISYACQGCYKLMGIFIANLNPLQKQTCKTFSDPSCFQYLAPALSAFSTCSGKSFPDITASSQSAPVNSSEEQQNSSTESETSSAACTLLSITTSLPVLIILLMSYNP